MRRFDRVFKSREDQKRGNEECAKRFREGMAQRFYLVKLAKQGITFNFRSGKSFFEKGGKEISADSVAQIIGS